jgi:hypothetical protein
MERYLVIVRGAYKHARKTKLAIAFIWVLGLLVAVIYVSSPSNVELDESLLNCNLNPNC